MSAEEKAEVCAECGRGRGWHDVWCSALQRIPVGLASGLGAVKLESSDVQVQVIQKLEEVE